jgi:hypothetical protein
MDMPPSRYRVVERGRRLVVIDTQRGVTLTPTMRAPAPRRDTGRPPVARAEPMRIEPTRAEVAPLSQAPKAGVGDGQVWVTQSWYDAKAPRRIPINFVNRQRMKNLQGGLITAVIVVFILFFLWPMLPFVLVFLLFGMRKKIKGGMTKFIDTLQTG